MTETQTETSGRQKQHICCSLKVGTTCKGLLSKSLSYIRKVFLCPSPSHPFFFWRMFAPASLSQTGSRETVISMCVLCCNAQAKGGL